MCSSPQILQMFMGNRPFPKYCCCYTLTRGHCNMKDLWQHISQYLRVHCSSINLTGIISSNSIPHKQTQTTLLLSDLTITLPHKVILESFWQWQPQLLQLIYTQLILNHLSTTVPRQNPLLWRKRANKEKIHKQKGQWRADLEGEWKRLLDISHFS